ncbi:MAG TPA: ABC transporter permease, partial [Candidatus Acidoferrum sp.]|nr:ABC transporter permease [Candidatus Acidoferrum sp.]
MSWFSRFKNACNPRRLDDDLADEMRDHIERRAAEFRDRGLSEAEAQRQAARAFGNLTGIREASREIRLWTALEGTLQDIRYAWRGLFRNPVFAATTIASLGLAIGANTAIYSIIDAALLRPLPVPQPERLVTLATSGESSDIFSYPQYEQLRVAAGDAARLALFDSPNRVEAKASGSDAPYEEVVQQLVSPDAFEILGVPPALGALFSPAEDHYPGPRAVVVLSYAYWQRRFGGDPAILGRTFTIDNRPYAIVGIAREGFSGTEPGKFVDAWLPVTVTDPGIFIHDARLFHFMGRLTPGVSREQLADRLQPAFHRDQEIRSSRNDIPAAVQKQMRETILLAHSGANGVAGFRRTFSRPLWILFGVSACILLIACANMASLLLARS